MSTGPGIMVDAGFIDLDGKITPKAKAEMIKQIKEELKNGSNQAAVFPCGIKIEPDPEFNLKLEDETQFPDFHKNAFANYEKIAQTLNTQGNFSILPICDPLALKAIINPDLNLKIKFKSGDFIEYLLPNLPNLAVKFELEPPELAAKFPSLLKVPPPIPEIPIPKIPAVPPDFSVPDLSKFVIQFPELFKFNQPYLKIPEILTELLPKIPNLALKIASVDIPSVFTEVCKLVNSKAFPPPNLPANNPSPPSDYAISIAVANVTSRMMSSMMTATAVGLTVGSAPDGLVGQIGVEAGVKNEIPEEEEEPEKEITVRDKIAVKALRAISTKHGGTAPENLSYYRDKYEYAKFLLYTEYGDGKDKSSLPKDDPNYDPRVLGRDKVINQTKLTYSSCGMTARACLWSAGASFVMKDQKYREVNGVRYYYNFFTDEYRGFDMHAIIDIAKKLGAIKYIANSFGKSAQFIKKGDIWVMRNISEPNSYHMCVSIADFDGQSLQTVEGGQAAPAGISIPGGSCSTIKRFKYYDKNTYSGPFAGTSGDGNEFGIYRQMTIKDGICILGSDRKNYIYVVMDGEIMATNKNFSQIKNPKFERNDLALLQDDENININIINSLST